MKMVESTMYGYWLLDVKPSTVHGHQQTLNESSAEARVSSQERHVFARMLSDNPALAGFRAFTPILAICFFPIKSLEMILHSSTLLRRFHFAAWVTNKTFPKSISRHRRHTLAGYASKQVLQIHQNDWGRWHALHLWTACGTNCFPVARCLTSKANLSSENIGGVV